MAQFADESNNLMQEQAKSKEIQKKIQESEYYLTDVLPAKEIEFVSKYFTLPMS